MIIECPACATRYEIPDGSIGSAGRNVRCAKCKHSWHATAIEADDAFVDPVSAEPPVNPKAFARSASPQPERAATERETADVPRREAGQSSAEALKKPPLSRQSMVIDGGPAAARGAGTHLDAEPVARLHRSRPMWSWAAVILGIMVAAAIAAIAFWGLPDWVPGGRQAAAAEPELVLHFPDDQQGMRQLANGTEFFGASGTITNTGSDTKRVPPILIVLRDSRERIVYSFEVVPPKHSLAPGESMAVSEAVTEVPRSARVADIGWKPG